LKKIETIIEKTKSCAVRNYYLLTSVLIFLSFPSFDVFFLKGFSFFGWFAFIPLFLYIRKAKLRECYRASFFTSLIGAFLAFGWIRNFGASMPGGEIVITAFLMPVVAFFWSGRILFAEILSRRYEKIRWLIFPTVWIAFDLVQTLGYLSFPWTFIGYSQYSFLPFIQVSSFIGLNGITFILILSSTLLSDLIHKREEYSVRRLFSSRVILPVILLFLVISGITICGASRLYHGTDSGSTRFNISIVQSCISPWDDWDRKKMFNLNELKVLSEKALVNKTDLLIWSESATLEPISYDYKIRRLSEFDRVLTDFIRSRKVFFLTGEIGVARDSNGRLAPQNSAVLLDPDGAVVKNYAKIFLVPFGEWFPYEKLLPWVKDITQYYGGSSFIPGKTPEIMSVNGVTFGVLICYEGMFSRLNREYANKGPEFIVDITNDGWSNSFAGHFQHFSAYRFRAIENGLWYVRSGNTGITAFIDRHGNITATIPMLKKGYLSADIGIGDSRKTFYRKYGDFFSYSVMILLTLLIVVSEILIRRKKPHMGEK
jgi:apolipoprotein N-acyltransferase